MPCFSFSVPEMLPALAYGVLAGGTLDFDRVCSPGSSEIFWARLEAQAGVESAAKHLDDCGFGLKRQTIRPFDWRDPNLRSFHCKTMPGDYVDIWWKQRAKDIGFCIGRVKLTGVHPVKIWRATETLSHAVGLQLYGSRSPLHGGQIMCLDDHSIVDCARLVDIAMRDGFESLEAFRDYFVPKPGDSFYGLLYTW